MDPSQRARPLFLPLEVEGIQQRRPPFVVLAIVLLCFAVFLIVAALALSGRMDSAVRLFAALGVAPSTVRVHTLFTYWVLHENLLHLSLNMLFLMLFGGAIEAALGSPRIASLLVTSAVVTGMTEAAAATYGPSGGSDALVIGASGMAAAVLGAFAGRFHSARVRIRGLPGAVRPLPLIGAMIVAEVGFVGYRALTSPGQGYPMPANWAHLVGFLYGIVWEMALSRIAHRKAPATDAEGTVANVVDIDALEARVAAEPRNPDLRSALAMALAREGDTETARGHAAEALKLSLSSRDARATAERFAALKSLKAYYLLPADSALELAAALTAADCLEDAVAVYLSILERPECAEAAAPALLRAAGLLLRRLHRPAEAVEILNRYMSELSAPEWRGYAERLLRTASEQADS